MWPFRPYPELRQAIVNLKGSDVAFEGVVWGRRGGYLVLRNVRQLRGDRVTAVDDEVAIPMANIEFLQVTG